MRLMVEDMCKVGHWERWEWNQLRPSITRRPARQPEPQPLHYLPPHQPVTEFNCNSHISTSRGRSLCLFTAEYGDLKYFQIDQQHYNTHKDESFLAEEVDSVTVTTFIFLKKKNKQNKTMKTAVQILGINPVLQL